ncbi:helix-turn-helix domain-containing protein [Veillonella parvula]|uniref:helix-turn-helix domain-containing protein n=1 Tax=Veillonella parvula TaxID=29466 RepID=UPI00241F1E88|nr:helix-turn-helix transcriptional regulator [Veillonella parvula]MBS5152160.1 helix-turn-helix transcriptional regulator [Veillonella parvula]
MFERIEQLMRENSVSAYKLSKETGIAQSTLSSWKNQNKIPRVDLLQKIADYFGVEIGYLTGKLDKTKETPKIQRKIDASTVNLKNVKVMFYGDYELTEQEKKMVENVIKGVISSRKDERNKK